MALNWVLLIVGLVICFGGFVFRKVTMGVVGFFWGAVAAAVVVLLIALSRDGFFGLSEALEGSGLLVTMLIVGVIMAALSVLLDRFFAAFNAFMLSFLLILLVALSMIQDLDGVTMAAIISLILGAVIGFLSYVYHRYGVILVTAFTGAAMAVFGGLGIYSGRDIGDVLFRYALDADLSARLIVIAMILALGTAGFFVQKNRFLLPGGPVERRPMGNPVMPGRPSAPSFSGAGSRSSGGTRQPQLSFRPAAGTGGMAFAGDLPRTLLLMIPAVYLCYLRPLLYRFANVPYPVHIVLLDLAFGLTLGVMIYFVLTQNLTVNLIYQAVILGGLLMQWHYDFPYLFLPTLFIVLSVLLLWLMMEGVHRYLTLEPVWEVLLLTALAMIWLMYVAPWIHVREIYFYFRVFYLMIFVIGGGAAFALLHFFGGGAPAPAQAPYQAPAQTPYQAPGRGPAGGGMRFCPKCGGSVSPNLNFCTRCGARLR